MLGEDASKLFHCMVEHNRAVAQKFIQLCHAEQSCHGCRHELIAGNCCDKFQGHCFDIALLIACDDSCTFQMNSCHHSVQLNSVQSAAQPLWHELSCCSQVMTSPYQKKLTDDTHQAWIVLHQKCIGACQNSNRLPVHILSRTWKSAGEMIALANLKFKLSSARRLVSGIFFSSALALHWWPA